MRLLQWFLGSGRDEESAHVPSPPTSPETPPQPTPAQPAPFIIWREESYPMEAVGEAQFQDALERICGPHTRHGYRVEVNATLTREPRNPHDPNAVAVVVQGEKVGYLPREQAERVGAQMDEEGFPR